MLDWHVRGLGAALGGVDVIIRLPASELPRSEAFALELDVAKGNRSVRQSSPLDFDVIEEPPLSVEERAAVETLVAASNGEIVE